MRAIHVWRSEERPEHEYVEGSWGYARCVKCRAQRFFHESGPKGGVFVTLMWQGGHTPLLPGIPKRYHTTRVGGALPPCIYVIPTRKERRVAA